MIGTIRKHQQWLWFIIIVAIVVSFVWFFSPNVRMHSDEAPRIDLGSINGEPITPKQFNEARKEATLQIFLNSGQWPKEDERFREMVKQAAYERILLAAKLKEMNIEVPTEATARMVKQIFRLPPDEALPTEQFQKFVQTQLLPNRITEDDFERFVSHQVGLYQLVALYGMSGKLVTTNEVESFYKRENEPIVAEAAIFSISNYLSQVSVTPKEIEDYYKAKQPDYRLPERVAVNYVEFAMTNYMPEVDKELAADTNLTARIDAIYSQQGAQAFKDKAGKPMSEKDAKAEINARIREATALSKANKAANAFLTDLDNAYSDTNPYKPEDFEKTAQAKGLTVKSTEPFDKENGPRDIASSQFVQAAFRLVEDPTDPSKKSLFSSSPVETEQGVYAISLKQRFPSEMQSLETVRAQVTRDYTRTKAAEKTMAAGRAFADSVTNGLASGKSFNAICAAEKVKPTTLSPFSLVTRSIPEVDANDFERIQRVAAMLPNGKSSPMIPGMESGYVIYVKNRLPVDMAKMNTELPTYIERERSKRQSAAFYAWMQKTAKDMNLVIPRAGM